MRPFNTDFNDEVSDFFVRKRVLQRYFVLRMAKGRQIRAFAAAHAFAAIETKTFIQRMRVPGPYKLCAGLQLGVAVDAFEDTIADSIAAMFGRDNDIANPGEGGVVSDGPREAHLCAVVKETEAERMLD